MCGIRETQEEYPNPERKKKTVLAIRYPLGVFWIFLKNGKIMSCVSDRKIKPF
jgi:hypothetical protein